MGRVGVFASPDEAREFKQLLLQLRAAGYALQGGQKRQAIMEAPEPIVVYNNSGEAIPSCAIMQCIDSSDGVIAVDKPADRYGTVGPFLLNGPNAIEVDKRGVGTCWGSVLVHTDGTALTAQDRLSPEANEWYAIKNPIGNMIYLGNKEIRSTGDQVQALIVGFPQLITFKSPVAGIAARTGSTTITKGQATCDIWAYENTAGQIRDTTFNETIYNIFSTAMPGLQFGKAALSERGEWDAVTWEC